MKHFVKFFVVTLFLIISTQSFAEQRIVFVDLTFVLNNSKAGKDAQDFLKKTYTDKQNEFTDTEKKLKKEESDLLEKKTIMSKEDYKKNLDNLRKKVADYQNQRRKALDQITKKRTEARKQLLDKINPIMETYANENNISLIVDRKIILVHTPNTDITNIVIEKLNKVLPSLNLK